MLKHDFRRDFDCLIRIDKKEGNDKIYVRARMYPGLQITRSLGDVLAHNIGVTSEPTVFIDDIKSEDKFITVATDGIWRNLGPQEIGDIVSETFIEGSQGATCEIINQKMKDVCLETNKDLEDVTMIISALGPLQNH